MTLLALENVTKSYGATAALDNISLRDLSRKDCRAPWTKRDPKNNLDQTDQWSPFNQMKDVSSLMDRIQVPATKAIVSYLPDTTYLNEEMKVKDALTYFKTFYQDFNLEKAQHLLADLGIDENSRLKKLSKGNKEKVQLIPGYEP